MSVEIPALVIRADGSASMGTGHVMRCLALAQAWRHKGGRVIFLQAGSRVFAEDRLNAADIEVSLIDVVAGTPADAAETIRQAQSCGARWVVGDGYGLGDAWQKMVRAADLQLLIIDDIRHAQHKHANMVLNQNLSAEAGLYPERGPETRLLLGTRFALLRREFLGSRHQRNFSLPARRILITVGGSDADNVTSKVIDALAQLSVEVEATVLVGGLNPHLDQLKQQIASLPASAPKVQIVVNAANIPELMARADVAISAAGSTSWEIAYQGLPAVFLVIADNQLTIADSLVRAGVGINMGERSAWSPEGLAEVLQNLMADGDGRRAMSEAGNRLVDGHGSCRVAAALGAPLKLTIVSDADSWVNARLTELKERFEQKGHLVRWVHTPKEVEEGDIAFFLSLSRIVSATILARHAHNLVVHASALPHGRGWSPLTWQILEGRSEIPISLLEAAEAVDAGDIYYQRVMRFQGNELVDELREEVVRATMVLCQSFVERYPFVCAEGRQQVGDASYYPRRGPEHSRVDPEKPLREQFNLLRVCDAKRYPAFFEISGRRFEIHPVVEPDAPKGQ